MMNFKTIRKVGLSALLAGTFALGSDESVAAPVLKDTETVTITAKQTDAKMKETFDEQEKLLTPEQKVLWEKIKNCPEFSKLVPSIKLNLDLSKLKINLNYVSNYISIPFEKDRYLYCGKTDGRPLFAYSNRHDNNEFVFPTHEVPEFIKDKSDCYFYTTKSELKGLSVQEKEFIQTLDKCLNAIYHHMYGTGFTDIDEEKLASGAYAGYSYETHALTLTPNRRMKNGLSDLEVKIYEQFGFPFQIKDMATKGSGYFIYRGGCTGETLQYSSGCAGIFGNPWPIDISKDRDRINKTIYQARLRELEAILINCEHINNALPAFLKSIDKSAGSEFKKLIGAKVKTIRTYNKLLSRLPKINSWPKSLAHLKNLDKYIKKNYQNKIKDEENISVTPHKAFQHVTAAVLANTHQKG